MAADFLGADITEALEPPAHLNTDDNARSMLGALRDFGDLMSKLGPLYTDWCDHPAALGGWHRQPKFGDGVQEGAGDPLINKLNQLNWGMMDDAYQWLDNAHTAALAIGSAARKGLDQPHAAWRGDAGENAAATFSDLHSAARHYADELESLAGQLKGVRETTRDAVRRLADFADESADAQEMARDRKLAYDRGTPGTPTVDAPAEDPKGDPAMAITWGIVSLFSSDQEPSLLERWQDYANQLRVVLADGAYSDYLCPQGTLTTRQGFGVRVPVSTADLRAPGRLVVHSESGSVWGDQVVNVLDDFAQRYHDTMFEFRCRVEQTVRQVDDALRELMAKVTVSSDPFGSLGLGADPGGVTGGRGVSPADGGEWTPPMGLPAQPTSSAGVLGMPGAYGASSGVLPEYSGQQQTVKITDGDRTISAGDGGRAVTQDGDSTLTVLGGPAGVGPVMPMFGGFGAGGDGADIERGTGFWRTTGDLFDDQDDSGVGPPREADTERDGTA